jgi:hypothetical protein
VTFTKELCAGVLGDLVPVFRLGLGVLALPGYVFYFFDI